MEPTHPAPRSRLFLVRIWEQPAGGAGPGWQGKLQPLLSGEAYSFADWAGLVDLLVRLAGFPTRPETPPEGPPGG